METIQNALSTNTKQCYNRKRKSKTYFQIKCSGLQEHFQSHKFLLCYTYSCLFLPRFSFLAVDSTLLNIWASNSGGERIDSNPQQREDGCKENWPNNHNGGCSVLAPHQALEEGVQVNNHPEGEEELSEKWAPGLVPAVYSIRDTGNNSYQVDYEESGRWY